MRHAFYLSSFAFSCLVLFTGASCHKSDLPTTQVGNWVQTAAINAYPRAFSTAFVIGDTAYVGIGYNESMVATNNGRLNDFWAFRVNTGWTILPNFPGPPRSNATGFSLDNYGYVGLGYDGVFNIYKDFYQYDPSTNSWSMRAQFPGNARYDAIGFGLQGKGYVGTGFNVFWMNDLYQYDPLKDSWVQAPGTSGNFSKRRGAIALVYNNKAYIVTGAISGGMAKDFWSFDPSSANPWARLHDIAPDSQSYSAGYTDIVRQNAVGFVNGKQAYITTGINGGSMVSSTWVYDFATDLWDRRTPYPRQARYGAVGFTVSGQSYVGTGFSGNATFDDFNQFQPNVPYNPND